jgi:hypothetical protein
VYADTVIDEDSIITFNTGSYEYKLVSEEEIEALYEDYEEAVEESGEEDAQREMELLHYQAYDEDGNYTIQLEADAFFPYEVQFTCGGTTYNKWFETPDSMVKIGGHEFRVTSQTSGEVVTQMSLTVAGKTVVVYPEEKEFVNDENSLVSVATLLPIEEKNLTADLSGFSPLELSRVGVTNVFTDDQAVGADQYVMYKQYGTDDDYQTASLSSPLNLSYNTYYGTRTSWEMIVGEKDQLADSNIRYIVSVTHDTTSSWLTPSVYRNDNGNRVPVVTTEISYYDYGSRALYVRTQGSYTDKFFVSLSLNQQYADAAQKNIKVFEGKIEKEDDLKKATDITDNIWNVSDLTVQDSGYQFQLHNYPWITLVEYDSNEAIIGLLPVQLDFYSRSRNGLSQRTMYKVENGSTT